MRNFCWLAAGLALALPAAANAAPQAFPPWPTARGDAAIRDWIGAETDLQPGQILVIDGGAIYAAAGSDEDKDENGVLTRLIREEIAAPALAARLGGRSSRALIRFDCAHKTYAVARAGVFPGNNLSGGPEKPISGAAWMQASPAYLFDLAEGICGAPRPPAEAAPSPAPAAPTEAPPTAPSPAETPPPAEPAPKSAVSAPAADGIWVQAGAFASTTLAEAQWSGLEPKLPPGTGHRLEPAPGRRMTRLLIGPFPSKAAAAKACARVKSTGGACFVRR